MKKTELVKRALCEFHASEPIFIDEIAAKTGLSHSDISKILYRLKNQKVISSFQKGIYYKPHIGRFGSLGINRQLLLEKKHMKRNGQRIGYLTGYLLWNQWKLTTQVPKRIWVSRDIKNNREDKTTRALIIKAKGEIKESNVFALQFLDVIGQIDLIPDTPRHLVIDRLKTIYYEEMSDRDRECVSEQAYYYSAKVNKLLYEIIQ